MSINLPGPDARTVVLGSTGSGKTQFSVWLLSTRDFHRRAWFILDFKGDELLDSIGAKLISIREFPKEPGLYIIRPLPGEDYLVSQFFYKCWVNENVGVFIDEGGMVPKMDKWFRACLTQGRSKHVEMIICSQRPVWLDKYVFTEAWFYAVFNINFVDDNKAMRAYLGGITPKRLTKYHSLWYDVSQHKSAILGPVPNTEKLIEIFNAKLDTKPMKI